MAISRLLVLIFTILHLVSYAARLVSACLDLCSLIPQLLLQITVAYRRVRNVDQLAAIDTLDVNKCWLFCIEL